MDRQRSVCHCADHTASEMQLQKAPVPTGFRQALESASPCTRLRPPALEDNIEPIGAALYQTDWTLNPGEIGHWTRGLRELADRPLTGLVTNGCPPLFQETPEPGEGRAPPQPPCRVCRLVIVIGSKEDASIRGARAWANQRAATLGGCFLLWEIRSLSATGQHPFVIIRVRDITGGRLDGAEMRDYQVHGLRGFDRMHPELQDIGGRFEEVVVFHHGREINENRVVEGLWKVLVQTLRIPVCRLVYWSCNAAVELDVSDGGWMDALMRNFGGLAQYDRCPCPSPVELIYPTAGKCAINKPTAPVAIQTGDGRVNRIRWGYTHGDGSLRRDPDPTDPQPTRNPPDRIADQPGAEQVMGVPVTSDPSLR